MTAWSYKKAAIVGAAVGAAILGTQTTLACASIPNQPGRPDCTPVAIAGALGGVVTGAVAGIILNAIVRFAK